MGLKDLDGAFETAGFHELIADFVQSDAAAEKRDPDSFDPGVNIRGMSIPYGGRRDQHPNNP
jgi:hypothetical protein